MHELILLNNHKNNSNSITPIKPLRVRDDCFEYIDGTRMTVKECTDFKLFHEYLLGHDIRPILSQRAELGFNMCRVLGSCHNMFKLYPKEMPQYLLKLDSFFSLYREFNLLIEFTVFADAPYSIPRINDQQNFWVDVGAVAQENDNVILELVNENDVHWNTIETSKFQPIKNVLCSHGSNGSGSHPVTQPWNYAGWHSNDLNEWWRKSGHNAMEYYKGDDISIPEFGVPVYCNEKTRPDKDGNINHHEDDARACALLTAGSCYHSEQGKFSQLFTGRDLEFATAFIRGAESINLEAQGKNYIHRRDLEGINPVTNQPTKYLRVYQKGNEERLDHMVYVRF